MRTTVRWMLPAAGAVGAILAGASQVWAVSTPTATSTTPAGATTTSTLTWDVTPTTGSVTCQLSWDDGSGPALVGSSASCPFTNNPADPNQVAYAVPGQHAGKYALAVTTPSAGSVTSSYVDVAPVKPTLTGPAGPSSNRTPGWTIASIDPEGAVTCSATSPQLAAVSASCTPTPDATGQGSVSLNLASAANDATVTVTVTVTAHGESSSATTTYALDVTPPSPATLTPTAAWGTGRTPSFGISNVESGAAVACSLTDQNGTSVPSLISACDSSHAALNLTGAPDSVYTLAVKLTDIAGNSSTSSATYTLLPPAPAVTAPTSPSRDDRPTFTVSEADPTVTLTCTLTGLAGATLASPCSTGNVVVDLSGAASDGTVRLTVTAKDAANLTNSGSATYTVDRQVSTPTLSFGASSGTSRRILVHADDTAPDLASLTCAVTDADGAPVVAPAPCSSSTTIDLPTGALDGDYTVVATATDDVGNTASATATYTLLLSPPVLAALPAPSTNRTVPFSFTTGPDVVSITCSVSGPGGWTWSTSSCTSPGSFTIPSTGLDGDYDLTVTVTDHLGNTASHTRTYTLLQSAPVLAPLPAPSTIRTVGFSFDPGVDVASVTCSVAGPGGWAWSDTSCTSPGSFVIPTNGLDGDYVLTVTVTDHLNHQLSDSGTYTLLPSEPYLTAPAPATTSQRQPSWTITDDVVDLVRYECVSSAPVVDCGPTVRLNLDGLVDGTYWVDVDVVDSTGAKSMSLRLSVTLIPPAPYATKSPTSPSSTLQPSWTIADDVVDFSHYACTSSVRILSCTSTVKLDLSGLVDGTYTVTVQAVDSRGVAGDAVTLAFTLIPPAPYVVTAPATPASARSPQWTFGDNALDATGYTCSATGPGGITATALCSPTSSDVSLDLTGLVDGTYLLTVSALDAQGRAGDPFTVRYTLIPPAPVPTAAPVSPSSTRAPQWTLTDGAVDFDHYFCSSSVRVVSCTSTVRLDLSGLVDGTYSVTVRAVDSLGVAGDPVTLSFTMIPPAPYVVAPPATPSSARTPAWSIHDDVVDISHYMCTSSVRILSCTSTVQLDLTGLADGTYSVTVRAVDRLGVAGDPVILTYTLIPPAPVVVSSPVSPSAVRQPAWSLTDGAAGVVTYTCSATGPGGLTAPVACSGATVVLDSTGLPDGTYTVVVRAVDSLGAAGDAATLSYLLVPPPPTVTSAPASPWNSRSPQWTVADAVAGVTYSCTITGPSSASVSCAGGTVTLNLAAAADGVYTVSVLAVDALGHTSDSSSPLRFSYQLDTLAPVSPTVAVTPSPSQGRTATYTISGVEPAGAVACTFSAPVGATVTVPTACGAGATLDLTGQPDGAYTLTATVTDVAGNTSAATVATYVLDTTPPVAPIASIQSPGNDLTPTPTLIVEPGVTLTCAIQKYFRAVATVPCGTDGTVDLTGLGDGEYEISLWATDAAGNVGPASAPYSYLLDTVPPATPVLTSPASPSPVEDPVWRWTSDPATTGTCTVTSATGAVVTGPMTCSDLFTGDFTALPDGAYTLSVVLGDIAGNLSRPATSLFLLDRTAPVPPTVVPPASPGNTTSPRWLITAPHGATLTCTLTRGRTVILGPGACPAGGLVSLLGMPDGSYTMRVTATDSAGNVSAASITTYVLDTVAPSSPTLDYGSPSSGTSRTPFWGFTLPAGATGRCELLSGGTVVAVRNDCRGAASFTITGNDGQYYLRVIAFDAAGNASGPLVVGYQLYGNGGGAGASGTTTGGAGGARPARGPRLSSPSAVQRLIDHLGGATGQAGKAVRKAAGDIASALPSLPVIHDPLTNNVSHAVQNVINAVSKAGGGTGFPLLLLVVVGFFLMAQSRMDRRDPKLALASVAADDNLQFGPPPSRGDA